MKTEEKPLSKPVNTRQRKAAKLLAEAYKSDGKARYNTKKDILLAAGYSAVTAEAPASVIERPGFQAELAKYGLTEELVTSALVTDIELKPQRRFLELSLAAEILGMKSRAFNAHAKDMSQGMNIQNAVIVIHTPSE